MPHAVVLVSVESPVARSLLSLSRRLLGEGATIALTVVIEPPPGSGPARWRALLERLDAAEAWGRELVAPGTAVEAVVEADGRVQADLAAIGPSLPRALSEAALAVGAAVLWAGPGPGGGAANIALPYTGSARALVPPLAWFDRHPGSVTALRAVALDADARPVPDDLPGALLSLPAPFTHEGLPPEGSRFSALRAHLAASGTDLVAVLAPSGAESWPALLMLHEAGLPCPLLLIPGDRGLVDLAPRLEMTDLLELDGRWLGGVVRVDGIGRIVRVDGEELSAIADGAVLETVPVTRGAIHLSPSRRDAVGLSPTAEAASLEAAGQILRLPGRPIHLFLPGDEDRPSPAEARRWVVHFAGGPGPEALRGTGAHGVLDGDALLGDGADDDLPVAAHVARLERVRRRLALHGGPVIGAPPPPRDRSRGERLRVLAGAHRVHADILGLHLDNEGARAGLLALLDGATRSIWLQTYMFEDDPVGRAVAASLRAAADRGVQVCLLVDAVFSGYGVLGRPSPVLAELDAHPSASLRVSQPVRELRDLRRREHRKLLIIDGEIARVSGRNIGAPYYTGWGEVALGPDTPIREVPWLDASVDVRGGVVSEAARSFAASWAASGGEQLALDGVPPDDEGAQPCHLVLHESLADAFTLEAYRVLLESAQRTVTLVNTFPVQFELQRVLLGILARGVELRFLVGNVRPLHGARVPFPGEPYRQLATDVVHGRLDPLARAGADVREFVLPWRRPWDPVLDRVLPHVHAKLLTVDGEVATLGSANLDIAASYWDNEALLVIEDPGFCARLDKKLDVLFQGSHPFDPADEAWQERAAQREGISRRWPGWTT
jgi:cardiolipin synthase